jgi:hypothetical protein
VAALQREAAFRGAVETAVTAVRNTYAKTDPGVTVTVAGAAEAPDAWTEGGTRSVLDLVAVVPSGPLAMSPDFEGLVETSTSVGRVATDGAMLTLHSLSRSSNDSALPDVIAALDASARLAGGSLAARRRRRPALSRLKPSPLHRRRRLSRRRPRPHRINTDRREIIMAAERPDLSAAR